MINIETPGVYSPCDHVVGRISRSYKCWYGEKISEFIAEYSKYNNICICQVSSDDDISIVSDIIPNIIKIYRTSLQSAIIVLRMEYLINTITKDSKLINYLPPEVIKSRYTNGIEFLEIRLYPRHSYNSYKIETEIENNKKPYYMLIFRVFYKDIDQVVPKLINHLYDQKQELRDKLSHFQRRFDIISNINVDNMEETLNSFIIKQEHEKRKR